MTAASPIPVDIETSSAIAVSPALVDTGSLSVTAVSPALVDIETSSVAAPVDTESSSATPAYDFQMRDLDFSYDTPPTVQVAAHLNQYLFYLYQAPLATSVSQLAIHPSHL